MENTYNKFSVFSDFFAIEAAFWYPIYGQSAVVMPTLFETRSSHRFSFAVMPRIQFFTSVFTAPVIEVMEENRE